MSRPRLRGVSDERQRLRAGICDRFQDITVSISEPGIVLPISLSSSFGGVDIGLPPIEAIGLVFYRGVWRAHRGVEW